MFKSRRLLDLGEMICVIRIFPPLPLAGFYCCRPNKELVKNEISNGLYVSSVASAFTKKKKGGKKGVRGSKKKVREKINVRGQNGNTQQKTKIEGKKRRDRRVS